jgi:PhoPQ-activated pathogenicity-related protein
MTRSVRLLVPCALLLAAVVCLPASAGLLDYIAAPEPQYQWSYLGEQEVDAGAFTADAIYLNMTSQVWQGIPWVHSLVIFVPPDIDYPDAAMLFITGGSTGGYPGYEELYLGTWISNAIKAPVAVLCAVPNQPLFGGKYEDELIAYTFVQYLETSDETWPLLFPMAKSAVKAMDTVQAYVHERWDRDIADFVVTGASKRGWTTWLTGAADPVRVKGIAPMVIDVLNFPAQFPHQLETWGEYSVMIDDYTDLGLQDELSDPDSPLVQMVDPYAYRDRLTMPKLIINGSNDPYWVIDALNLYWEGLTAPKYVLYDPNSGHGLDDRDRVVNSLSAFFHNVEGSDSFPTMTWTHDDDKNTLIVKISADPKPVEARIWSARSDDLDFRDETWIPTPMTAEKGKKKGFVGSIPKSETQNTALFGEAEFSIGGRSFTLSTQVRVAPIPDYVAPGRSAFGRLRAGAAKLTITPANDDPQYLAGYDENRMMQGVHDDIWARVLYLTDGTHKLVLVGVDLIGLMKPDIDAIVAAVAPEVGTNVIVTNTHTHSGPDVIGLWGPDYWTPGWDEGYITYVQERIAQAIVDAKSNARPARLYYGSAMTTPEDRIAFNANERWFEADSPPWAPGRGRGPQDYEASVMRVMARESGDSQTADTIATVFNFACHPEVTGDSGDDSVKYYLSSDMGSYAYDEIESHAGGIAIWLQGALGAMVTADNEYENWQEAERIGRALGQRVLEGANTAELERNPQIAVATRTLHVPLYNETFYYGMLYGVLRNGPGRLTESEDGPFGTAITTIASVIQIGGLQIATTPGESYPKIGLDIKQNILTAPHKMVLGVSRDELGYILYPSDYGTSEYGYETTMSVGPTIGLDIEDALTKAMEDLNR